MLSFIYFLFSFNPGSKNVDFVILVTWGRSRQTRLKLIYLQIVPPPSSEVVCPSRSNFCYHFFFLGRKSNSPYRDVRVTFEKNGETSDEDDDDVEKPTFTVQPMSNNPLITPNEETSEKRNKYTWSATNTSSTVGSKNIAEWLDEQVRPLGGQKNNHVWNNAAMDSEAAAAAEFTEDSDSELLFART